MAWPLTAHAESTVFWPGITPAISALKETCNNCRATTSTIWKATRLSSLCSDRPGAHQPQPTAVCTFNTAYLQHTIFPYCDSIGASKPRYTTLPRHSIFPHHRSISAIGPWNTSCDTEKICVSLAAATRLQRQGSSRTMTHQGTLS